MNHLRPLRPLRLCLSRRSYCSSVDKKDILDLKVPLYETHILTSGPQKAILGLGSSLAALADPWRADMVAVSGEVTGHRGLKTMFAKMQDSSEGRQILTDRPLIKTTTIDFEYLRSLPNNTFGHTYAAFNVDQHITPDSRDPVQFVDDPDLAFVMQRYRETHDLVHALLGMPTNMVGEALVKWIEAIQTGLPMCIGAAILGPSRFKRTSQFEKFRKLRPWAIHVGQNSKFLLNTYFEQRWEQDLEDLRSELNIDPALP
jgi:ubiquinone biosynthesis protein COQ4